MSDTEKLHAVIEKMDAENGGQSIGREELRAVCEMLGLFPEHRFRKAFHQALERLTRAEIVERDDSGDLVLLETCENLAAEKRRQTARAAVDGGKVSGTALDAACDKLYALIEAAAPDNEPVDPYAVARGEMPLSESTPALLELYKRGRLRCFSSAAPGVLVVRARFDRSSAR